MKGPDRMGRWVIAVLLAIATMGAAAARRAVSTRPTDVFQLERAVQRGQIDIVRKALTDGWDLNQRNRHGSTLLHVAIQHDQAKVVELLLAKGAEVGPFAAAGLGREDEVMRALRADPTLLSAGGPRGSSLLHWAIMGGQTRLIRQLVANGADVNPQLRGGIGPPLTVAIRSRRLDVVRFLLDAGANMNIPLQTSQPPLCEAIQTGNLDMIKLLLQRGADVNVRQLDMHGRGPLMQALQTKNRVVAHLLIDKGADVRMVPGALRGGSRLAIAVGLGDIELVKKMLAKGAKVKTPPPGPHGLALGSPMAAAVRTGNRQMLELLIKHGGDLHEQLPRGMSLLQMASEIGNKNMVAFLLGKDMDPNVSGRAGLTAMHAAAAMGHVEVLKALLASEAAIDPIARNGSTPLGSAVSAGKMEAIEFLLGAGADATILSQGKAAYLRQAIMGGHREAVERVLKAGAAFKADGPLGGQTLIWAAQCDWTAMVEKLIDGGADINHADQRMKKTALHAAAENGKEGMLRLLIARKADVNSRNRTGHTPLITALHRKRIGCARILLQAGADATIADNSRRTPLFVAITACRKPEAVELLLRHGARFDPNDRMNKRAMSLARRRRETAIIALLEGAAATRPSPATQATSPE